MACTALHGSPYGQRGERSLVQLGFNCQSWDSRYRLAKVATCLGRLIGFASKLHTDTVSAIWKIHYVSR